MPLAGASGCDTTTTQKGHDVSRKRTRARRRAARTEELRAEVESVRDSSARFEALLRRLEAQDREVWDVARVAALDEDERSMVAQVAAPHVAERTSGRVLRRRACGN